ncbi:MAG: DNA (cytosine-5-)-methyltransferase [Micavibrio sp.]|nr:DNA (cytosine-5-)-methyltransferase [Micavibrio sp.]
MSDITLNEFADLRLSSGLSLACIAEELGVSDRTIRRWEAGETAIPKMALTNLKGLVRKAKFSSVYKEPQQPQDFRFIDLFAGIGGFRKGFEAVGGKCVFTSEWDDYSRRTYLANFECDHEVAGDITKVEVADIPDHDVLLAGFPCQPFSIAGVSKKNALGRKHGFACEAQGTLFFDIARIIKHHRPAAFVLENVKNLKSHDKGNTFDVIMKILREDLGYHVQERIIDAKSFVPQHRERIFIVGFRDETAFNIEGLDIPDIAHGPKLDSILHPEDGSEEIEDPFICGNIGRVNEKYTLSDKLWNYLQDYAAKHRAKGNGFGFGLCTPADTARTLSARYYKDGSEILIEQKGKNPRRLTPRECARLMGFDQPGQEKMVIPVSDTRAYQQFGNAVVVPVVQALAEGMKPFILHSLLQQEEGKKVTVNG